MESCGFACADTVNQFNENVTQLASFPSCVGIVLQKRKREYNYLITIAVRFNNAYVHYQCAALIRPCTVLMHGGKIGNQILPRILGISKIL